MKLSIRSEQMAVIEAFAEENFLRRIGRHLLEHYPRAAVILPGERNYTVEALSEEELQSLVRTGVRRARGYGFTFESTIACFTALMFEVCPNFDTHRLSQVLLNDEEVEPNVRLDELLEVLTEKNWETIRATYDPQAWEDTGEAEPADFSKAEDESPVAADGAKSESAPVEDPEKTVAN